MRPWLDVSDVVLCPEFADSVTVIRRPQVVDEYGENTVPAPTPYAGIIGVVTQAGPNDLKRLPDWTGQTQVISFITKFRLYGPSVDGTGQQYQPDLVQWNGNTYIVKTLQPYTRYGAGFTESLCEQYNYVPATEQS